MCGAALLRGPKERLRHRIPAAFDLETIIMPSNSSTTSMKKEAAQMSVLAQLKTQPTTGVRKPTDPFITLLVTEAKGTGDKWRHIGEVGAEDDKREKKTKKTKSTNLFSHQPAQAQTLLWYSCFALLSDVCFTHLSGLSLFSVSQIPQSFLFPVRPSAPSAGRSRELSRWTISCLGSGRSALHLAPIA